MRDFLLGVVCARSKKERTPAASVDCLYPRVVRESPASAMSKSTRPILGRPRHHRLARLVITDIDLNPQDRRHDFCDGATEINPDIPIEQAIPDTRHCA
jgi:hypothetical protein